MTYSFSCFQVCLFCFLCFLCFACFVACLRPPLACDPSSMPHPFRPQKVYGPEARTGTRARNTNALVRSPTALLVAAGLRPAACLAYRCLLAFRYLLACFAYLFCCLLAAHPCISCNPHILRHRKCPKPLGGAVRKNGVGKNGFGHLLCFRM